ncbi:MAG: prepilin-type N-terminal cleavage/methylation domain-containing protein [Planctomycetota bacterium]
MFHPAFPSRQAFTLIELILVLVIIATLVAVASPTLGRLHRKSKLDAAARTIVALHAEARSRALRDGRAYRVVIEPAEHRAWIEGQAAGGFTATADAAGREVVLDKTITLEFDDAPEDNGLYFLVCRPDGMTQPTGIVLTGAGDREVLLYCPSASEGMVVGEVGDDTPPAWGGELEL